MADFPHIGAQAGNASKAEAEAGTDNAKGMTPLRTAEAIAANREVLMRNVISPSASTRINNLFRLQGLAQNDAITIDIYGSQGNNNYNSGWWRAVIRHGADGNPKVSFVKIIGAGGIEFERISVSHTVSNNLMNIHVYLLNPAATGSWQYKVELTHTKGLAIQWTSQRLQAIPSPVYGSGYTNVNASNYVYNGLNSNDIGRPLSAAQGTVLANRIPFNQHVVEFVSSGRRFMRPFSFSGLAANGFIIIDIYGRGDSEPEQGWQKVIIKHDAGGTPEVEFISMYKVTDGSAKQLDQVIVEYNVGSDGLMQGRVFFRQSSTEDLCYFFAVSKTGGTLDQTQSTYNSLPGINSGHTRKTVAVTNYVEDSLTSTDERVALSAKQGKALKDELDGVKEYKQLWSGSLNKGGNATLSSVPAANKKLFFRFDTGAAGGEQIIHEVLMAMFPVNRRITFSQYFNGSYNAGMALQRTNNNTINFQELIVQGWSGLRLVEIVEG